MELPTDWLTETLGKCFPAFCICLPLSVEFFRHPLPLARGPPYTSLNSCFKKALLWTRHKSATVGRTVPERVRQVKMIFSWLVRSSSAWRSRLFLLLGWSQPSPSPNGLHNPAYRFSTTSPCPRRCATFRRARSDRHCRGAFPGGG